jgi:hypothetical protein
MYAPSKEFTSPPTSVIQNMKDNALLPLAHSPFSPSILRASLLETRSYAGSLAFSDHVTWNKVTNESYLTAASNNPNTTSFPSHPRACAVVGVVSPIHLYVRPHGNYSPEFERGHLENSQLQFQIVAPALLPGFKADFDFGVQRFKNIQRLVSTHAHRFPADQFVVIYNETGDGPEKALKFQSPLFEERVCTSLYLTHG